MGDLTPNTREEYFLARMAGEDVVMPEPITREEEYMKGIADAISGQNDINIPEPITREEIYAEQIVKNLEEITFDLEEKSITENGEYTAAADNKDGFSKVTVNVPAGNANIADGTGEFKLQSALNRIDIPNGYTSLGYQAFYNYTSLVSINLPSTLTSIGSSAFSNCTNLASIDLPSGMTSINGEMFSGCISLASIDLPSGIASINQYAFNNCTSLRSIICRATTPPTLGTNVFHEVPADCAIYVPAESVDTYKAASGWSVRANYIQAIPTT